MGNIVATQDQNKMTLTYQGGLTPKGVEISERDLQVCWRIPYCGLPLINIKLRINYKVLEVEVRFIHVHLAVPSRIGKAYIKVQTIFKAWKNIKCRTCMQVCGDRMETCFE